MVAKLFNLFWFRLSEANVFLVSLCARQSAHMFYLCAIYFTALAIAKNFCILRNLVQKCFLSWTILFTFFNMLKAIPLTFFIIVCPSITRLSSSVSLIPLRNECSAAQALNMCAAKYFFSHKRRHQEKNILEGLEAVLSVRSQLFGLLVFGWLECNGGF